MILIKSGDLKNILGNIKLDCYEKYYVYNSKSIYYNLTEVFSVIWHSVIYGLIDWEKYWEKSFKADDKMHGNASNFNQD